MTDEEREQLVTSALLDDLVLITLGGGRDLYLNPYRFDLDQARRGLAWFRRLVSTLEAGDRRTDHRTRSLIDYLEQSGLNVADLTRQWAKEQDE